MSGVVQKGFGYHLDLFVLSLLIIVCSVLGLPWFVAATVRSVTHVRSLIKYSDVSAPGERPEMLGVRSNTSHSHTLHCRNKKHLKNVGPIRYCEPPLHCQSPGVASRTPAIAIAQAACDVYDIDDDNDDNDNDNA